ncbi:MAG TPA: DUF507 family protein [Methylomirabilota bacterium]|jgi:hypothetical protein|nr:DUF507 family protein [Methylomirabilota bacterium]
MRYSESLCRHAAEALIETLSDKGFVRLRSEKKAVVEKIFAALMANFRQEEDLEKEAERLADEHIRKAPGVDRYKVTQLIKQRLAEERRFVL